MGTKTGPRAAFEAKPLPLNSGRFTDQPLQICGSLSSRASSGGSM
jgi:hypothetical protein